MIFNLLTNQCHTPGFRDESNKHLKQFCGLPSCRREPAYCFRCGGVWKTNTQEKCGNPTCDQSIQSKIDMIRGASLKTIGKANNVPSLRACPSCYTIIEHKVGCKHMACPFCKTTFCFLCLATKDEKTGVFKGCTNPNAGELCFVAPKQTNINV